MDPDPIELTCCARAGGEARRKRGSPELSQASRGRLVPGIEVKVDEGKDPGAANEPVSIVGVWPLRKEALGLLAGGHAQLGLLSLGDGFVVVPVGMGQRVDAGPSGSLGIMSRLPMSSGSRRQKMMPRKGPRTIHVFCRRYLSGRAPLSLDPPTPQAIQWRGTQSCLRISALQVPRGLVRYSVLRTPSYNAAWRPSCHPPPLSRTTIWQFRPVAEGSLVLGAFLLWHHSLGLL